MGHSFKQVLPDGTARRRSMLSSPRRSSLYVRARPWPLGLAFIAATLIALLCYHR